MKKVLFLIIACTFFVNSTAAFAQHDDPLMAVGDVAIARPLGLATTIIGGAAFLVALPFALTSGTVKETGDLLVGEPFRFTFSRPVGEFRQGSYSSVVETPKAQSKEDDAPPKQAEGTQP